MSGKRTCALTIAGFDPTGTVGMPVDLRTFTHAGVHGIGVATVVTAQDTVAIAGVTPMPELVVREQLDTLLADVAPAATKTGMLWSAAIANVVGESVGQLGRLVVDPVLVDGAGRRIIDESIDDVYLAKLFPAAAVITPNRAEAGLLLGSAVNTTAEAIEAARRLLECGSECVVVTAGAPGADQADVIATSHGVEVVEAVRHDVPGVRGSGDTLSAAMAAGLALGWTVFDAIENAISVTNLAIERGIRSEFGRGRPSAVQSAVDWSRQ